jgi:hypothetical protein
LNSAPDCLVELFEVVLGWSACSCIVRNFRQSNGRWPIPGRTERYITGPRELSLTASAIASSSGLSSTSSSVASDQSNVRLSAKSIPSNTGGRSGTAAPTRPGTNSARWIRISIVDGATRTVTPR